MQAVWSKDWIRPYESPWSVLEKFTMTNISTKNEVLYFLGSDEVRRMKYRVYGDIHRNLFTLAGFDQSMLHQVLGIDLKSQNDHLIMLVTRKVACRCAPASSWFYSYLRWCPECLKIGFHSVFHQFKLLNHCPFHLKKVVDRCPECHQQFNYIFTDKEFNGPFLCKCGYTFTDYQQRWNHWGSPLSIQCDDTLQWLQAGQGDDLVSVFNPRHAMNASNPIRLLLQGNRGINESIFTERFGQFHQQHIHRHLQLSGSHLLMTLAISMNNTLHIRSSSLQGHLKN